MRFFRSHRLELAALALFALACQFVLAFGHIHRDRLGDNSPIWAIAAVTGETDAAATPKGVSADLPTSPHRNPSGLGHDFCAICTSVSLMGALVMPAAPAVVPEISIFKGLGWSVATTDVSPIDHLPFSARGPPRS
jgi:hypothetical protein